MSRSHGSVCGDNLSVRFESVLTGLLLAAVASLASAEAADSPVAVQVSESPGRIVLQFTLGDYQTRTVNIGGRNYQEPRIAGEPVTVQAGAPQLPKVCRSLIIPDDAQMALRILAADYEEVSANILPSKGNLPDSADPRNLPYTFGNAYSADAFYPGELARLGTPYILRDYRGVVVELYPFQYNPVTGALRVYTNITLEVVRTGPGETNVLARNASERRRSRAFHQLYKHHFVNYRPKLRYPPLDEDGDMLIIVHDPWIPIVEPLAAHKNSIGIDTTVVGVSTIGNNAVAIQSYIQSVYDASDLAFVLLVGDIQQVATPYDPGAPSDPTYAKLAGGDDYPDVMVGRFSAQSPLHVHTQVQRTIEYEMNQATQQEWFWRGAGIGSEPGYLDALRDELLAHGYTHVDQIYDPDATPEMIAAALNEGRGIVNYIGHGSSSFWGTGNFFISDIDELVNADMLPFIFSVASLNGNFAVDECFAEAWLRAEQGGVPTGAIATYMASDYQYWDGPQVAQQEFVQLYVNEAYVSFGTLCFAGACRMIDEYGPTGAMMFDTWIVFGDPSLHVVGTVFPQSTWYVDDDAPNDPGPGDPMVSDPLEDGSPEHPFDAIQEGIDAAVDGDTVMVLDGTYTGAGNRDLDFSGKAIAVRSENGPDTCIIDCEGSEADPHRGFCLHSGESAASVVDGFCVCNGYVDFGSAGGPHGGGIYCSDSSLTVVNCTFITNTAGNGGGLYTDEGSPTLSGCSFVECHAREFGGGMYCEAGSATLDACTFAENSTDLNGAGLCVMSGAVELSGCSFTENDASYGLGGGLCCYYGSASLTGCTFSGNRALFGGGAFGLGGSDPEDPEASLAFVNCDFDNNQAEFYGGGLNGGAISMTLLGCTFARNLAGQYGGGLSSDFYSDTLLADCAFVENSANRGGGFSGREWADTLLVNCRFHTNAAGTCGGGLVNEGAASSLVDCTFVANRAAWLPRALGGGGVYCYGASHARLSNCTFVANESGKGGAAAYARESGAVLTNCVFWYNTGIYDGQLSGDPAVTYCSVEGGWPGDGNIDSDPQFVRVPDDGGDGWGDDPNTPDVDEGANDDYGDLHVQAGSPCIDAGCNCGVPPDFADLDGDGDTDEITPLDLDGEGRFFDDPGTLDGGSGWPPIVDMGAYEFGGGGPQPCVGDLDNDRDVDLSDLAGLLAHYGTTSGMTQANGDLDCDGDVDLSDLSTLLSAYGTSCG
jgi:hypothetical protein